VTVIITNVVITITGDHGVAGVSRGRSAGLVPFLFGVSGRAVLPGVVLTRLLGDLGMSESAARGLIARLRRDGHLAAHRRGRAADYRLAGEFARSFERVRDWPNRPPAVWSGHFHALLYEVPEARRGFRDALRRAAILAGYGILQQGVLICLTDRRQPLAEQLARAPRDARIRFARIAMDIPDAADAAARAWDLPELDRRYRAHAGALRTASADRAQLGPGATALRAFADLLHPALIDVLRTPDLPRALLPERWPGQDLEAAIVDFQRRLGPAAAKHVGLLLDEARPLTRRGRR
jgi:phenylacetic acid degradation operon negative regulatory protein